MLLLLKASLKEQSGIVTKIRFSFREEKNEAKSTQNTFSFSATRLNPQGFKPSEKGDRGVDNEQWI